MLLSRSFGKKRVKPTWCDDDYWHLQAICCSSRKRLPSSRPARNVPRALEVLYSCYSRSPACRSPSGSPASTTSAAAATSAETSSPLRGRLRPARLPVCVSLLEAEHSLEEVPYQVHQTPKHFRDDAQAEQAPLLNDATLNDVNHLPLLSLSLSSRLSLLSSLSSLSLSLSLSPLASRLRRRRRRLSLFSSLLLPDDSLRRSRNLETWKKKTGDNWVGDGKSPKARFSFAARLVDKTRYGWLCLVAKCCESIVKIVF